MSPGFHATWLSAGLVVLGIIAGLGTLGFLASRRKKA